MFPRSLIPPLASALLSLACGGGANRTGAPSAPSAAVLPGALQLAFATPAGQVPAIHTSLVLQSGAPLEVPFMAYLTVPAASDAGPVALWVQQGRLVRALHDAGQKKSHRVVVPGRMGAMIRFCLGWSGHPTSAKLSVFPISVLIVSLWFQFPWWEKGETTKALRTRRKEELDCTGKMPVPPENATSAAAVAGARHRLG